MDTDTLRLLLKTPVPPILLHVLPGEVFAAKRIPGSQNACVYEISFLENVRSLVPDKTTPLVVYGSGGGSWDSRVAAGTLRAEGYTQVEDFAGGLAGWEDAEGPLEGTGVLPRQLEPLPGSYQVDTATSIVRWTGRNLFNHHSGTLKLAGGTIVLGGQGLDSATFSLAMDSITCEDITDPVMNAMLIGHLQSADFFDVAKHPVATFRTSAAEPVPAANIGSPNFQIRGVLTLRGISREIAFPVVLASDGPGKLTGQAQVELDRTEFGSIYGSGRFFRFLGKHVVNDVIHLHLKIHAVRA